MKLPKGKNLIIFCAALTALIIPVILLENSVLQHTDGNFTYPLDNAYLDIAVAKNLAFYKVWGVSKYTFQSASSSLLYPLLLTPFFFIAGAHLIIPIVVNALLAIAFLYFLQQALIRRRAKPALQLTILLAVTLMVPLPLLVVSGMGYTLQLLLCFLFIESLAMAIRKATPRLPAIVLVYGALMIAARYEDIVLLILACLLLVILKQRRNALILAIISLSPILLFGVISLSKKSNFLPNSLLLGPYPGHIILLVILTFTICCLLIWQYRRLAAENKPISILRMSFTMLGLLALPFIVRNLSVLRHFKADSIRIYEQQYPIAAFVRRYYFRTNIGVNEIGAIAYFTDGRKLDYTGKASDDVVRSLKDHSWSPLLADSLSRKNGIRYAIVSDPWFTPEDFPKWAKVASWKLPDTQLSRGETVNFYVTSKHDTTWILNSLRDYERWKPASISITYY